MTIKIGTRGSKLALWQTQLVIDKLKKNDIEAEAVIIETKGDKILNKSVAKIGSKGVFTAELEEQLLKKKIDIAVHSAKDLASELPEGTEIIAYTEREEPHDVLISYNKSTRLTDFDRSFVIGTSSTRRVSLLKKFYPDIRTAEARGNIQTRMRKLEEGYYDALILAYAGIKRMGFEEYIVENLPVEQFIPPVGQGSIAIQANTKMDKKLRQTIRNLVNHEPTEHCLLAERAFLRELKGGCSVPVFGYAQLKEDNLQITGGVVNLDGKTWVKDSVSDHFSKAIELGTNLAKTVIADGANEILEEIKKGS